MLSCDGQIVWSRPPDPPLWTWEQAESASLTVTLIPIELISHHTNLPPSSTPTGRNRAAHSGVFLSRMSKCCTRDGQLRCLHCECRQKWIWCPNCNSARGGSVCSIFRCLGFKPPYLLPCRSYYVMYSFYTPAAGHTGQDLVKRTNPPLLKFIKHNGCRWWCLRWHGGFNAEHRAGSWWHSFQLLHRSVCV